MSNINERVSKAIVAKVSPDSIDAIVILNLKLNYLSFKIYLQTNIKNKHVIDADTRGDKNLNLN